MNQNKGILTQLIKAVASEVVDELESRNVFKSKDKNHDKNMILLNTKEASIHFGVDPRTVRRWVDRKIIHGEKVGSRYMIYVEREKLSS